MHFQGTALAKARLFPARGSVAHWLPNAGNLICAIHRARKDLFCEVDRILLCFLCSLSPRHATHGHYTLSGAAVSYREYFLMRMKVIWEKKHQNQKSVRRARNIIRSWERFINLRKTMIQAEYPKLCQYLLEEKQKHLELLEIEGKKILQGLKKNVSEMTNLGRLLWDLYDELKNMCQKTDEHMLLGLRQIVAKCESVTLNIPKPLEPLLSEKPISGFLERLHSFQVYITLDPIINNYRVPLLEELRQLQYNLNHQDTPDNLDSLRYIHSWGTHSFLSGKHYWEVNVRNYCNWIVGVCSESWKERDDMGLNSKDVFLLLSVKVNNNCSLFSTSPLLPQYIQRPDGLVGIFLDYDFGVISFVNVAKCSLICNFLPGFFSFPLRPFICYSSM
ncbi:tripartite motif-containing protein 77 [Sorex fumeus]|uniref:tripartite motif-containing protein 77 n=1 Tax=Sorex fumeus TaxID=62283 RepID=UPI0024AD9986|nr:tripartite motif-containing protein 77 [Sorex fumeus]